MSWSTEIFCIYGHNEEDHRFHDDMVYKNYGKSRQSCEIDSTVKYDLFRRAE